MNFRNTLIFISTALLVYSSAKSQSWPGYETGRFTGISSANLRPGGMAPMPYKVDATLFGVHLNSRPKNIFSKDIIGVMFSGGFKNLTGFSELRKRTNVFSNLQGPSIQVQAGKKLALAFAWNIRHIWLSEFSQPEVARLFDKETTSLSLNGTNESASIFFSGWNEFALGAGGVIWDKGFHSFSVGGFLKLVSGTGSLNVSLENMDVNTTGNNVEHIGFSIQAETSDNMSSRVDEGKFNLANSVGYGFDVGLEYKFLNPRSCPGASNYRVKAGFSLTDIGQVRYKSGVKYSQENAGADNIALERFRTGTFSAATDTLREIFNIDQLPVSGYNVMLPLSLRLYSEVNIRRRAIIYGEFHFIFAQLINPDIPMAFRFNLTPRFEDDRFGVYLPLTFTNYIPANAGLAIRMKPFIIGSENLFTFWAYDDRGTALDFFIAIKIPILNDDERIDWKTMGKKKR